MCEREIAKKSDSISDTMGMGPDATSGARANSFRAPQQFSLGRKKFERAVCRGVDVTHR